MKKNLHKFETLALILFSVGAAPAAEIVVAGWDDWGASRSSVENGISGNVIAPSGWSGTSGCSDGTFGTWASPAAATNDSNGYQSSGNSSYIEFDFKNSGWRPVTLSSIHFDAARRGATAPDSWELEIRPGSALSAGVVQQGTLDVTFGGDFQDLDIDLSTLGDAVLEEAEAAVFRITFSGGSGGGMSIDNVGLVGTLPAGHTTDIHYIYPVPANPTASLDIHTAIRTPINPMHLSLNVGAQEYTGFNTSADKERFQRFDPPSTRWPIGVWANWYDWENDGHRIYDDYDTPFRTAIEGSQGKRYGFPGLHQLHDELNFDVLFSWNVLYDTPAKGVNRLRDRLEKGFDFNWIELGNEVFWKDQRSNITATEWLYKDVAKSHAAALKAEDPYIQLAIPAQFRDTDGTGWNEPMKNDQNFFDAITVHKYIRSDDTSTGQADALKAGQTLLGIAEDMSALFPGKPQWYSEWGVCSGENAVSVIGQTDAFLTFFKHQEYFAMNQYHQVNGIGHMFITDTNKKTSWGAGYDVLRSVFLNSELFDSTLTATAMTADFDVVQAEASIRDGKITVFAVNKTPSPVPFTFSMDGAAYTGTADHRTFAFDQLTDFPEFEIEEDPLTVVALNTTTILLPPYSLNVIDGLNLDTVGASEILIEAESADEQPGFSPFETRLELGGHTYITMTNGAPTVNLNSVVEANGGIASYAFELTKAGAVSLEVLGKFETESGDGFWYRVDAGSWIKVDGLAGGSWKWVLLESEMPMTVGLHTFEIARRDTLVKLDRYRLTTVDGMLVEPRVSEVPMSGTVRIEAEDYDEGGEGFGYHDRTPGNAGGVYRNDGVDLEACGDVDGGYQVSAVQSGEWLRFPIDVEHAGTHRLRLRVSRTAAGDSSFRVLFKNENATGNLQFPSTGSSNVWITVEHAVLLEAGKQMMEVKLTGGDVDLNWIELKSVGVPAPWKTQDIGAVAASGSTAYDTGTFSLNASGSDIWNSADEFHFVYRPVRGDCEIIARVTRLENTNPWAKAGVMIRETLDANSINVATLLSAGNGVSFQKRTTIGGTSTSQNAAGLSAPRWVKLTRVGDSFTSYQSIDGLSWALVGSSQTVPMVGTVYVGMAATSHLDGTLGISTFDNVETVFALSAHAGVDQVIQDSDIDGIEMVALDASGSIPSDEYPIADYTWSRGSMPLATGLYANVTLPLGTHLLTLQVTDSNGATSSDTASITVEPGTTLGETSLLAGWETWNNGASSPATLTDGVTAAGANTGLTINADGSTDGTWGTWATPSADQTTDLANDSAFLANGAEGVYDFTVTDITGAARALTGFHFDSATFRPSSSRDYELSVLSGDLTLGSVASGNVPSATSGGQDWSDLDIDLTELADHELNANGSVTFRLAFTGGSLGAGGHHQYLDNVAISTTPAGEEYAYPDGDSNGLPDWWENFYFGTTGQVASVDSDLDGLSNGDELIAGTNPDDFNSRFVLHSFEEVSAGGYLVKWDSYSDRTYNVIKGANLTSNDWTSVSGPRPGTGGEMTYTDSTALTSNMFYKVEVSLP